MLARFSLLDAFFSVLVASFALYGHLWDILVVLKTSWTVPGSIFEDFGEARGTHFSKFFRTFASGLRKRFDPYKTLAGATQIKVFYKSQA